MTPPPMNKEIRVPDIGDFKNVPVIEIHVKPGDTIKAEDPLVTLESDKATMEVPLPKPARSPKSRSRSATKSVRAASSSRWKPPGPRPQQPPRQLPRRPLCPNRRRQRHRSQTFR